MQQQTALPSLFDSSDPVSYTTASNDVPLDLDKVLDHKVDPNDADNSRGISPLMYAATNGNASTVTILLAKGAGVDAVETMGLLLSRSLHFKGKASAQPCIWTTRLV